MLNIHDALKLVKLLLPHTPHDASEITVLEFGGKILESIIQSGQHHDFIEAMSLLMGVSVDDVAQLSQEESVKIFLNGLIENEYLALVTFNQGLRQHGR